MSPKELLDICLFNQQFEMLFVPKVCPEEIDCSTRLIPIDPQIDIHIDESSPFTLDVLSMTNSFPVITGKAPEPHQ